MMDGTQAPQATEILIPDSPPSPTEETLSPEAFTRAKLLGLFEVYPVMSASMLQAALGTTLSPALWRPIYDHLIQEGILVAWEQAPHEDHLARSRPYQCISLAPKPSDD